MPKYPLDPGAHVERPIVRNTVHIVAFENHVFAEAAGRIGAEAELAHIEAGGRHKALFTIVARSARQDAIGSHLVADLEIGNGRTHLNDFAAHFVARSIGAEIVPPLSGMPFETVHVGTADAACLGFHQQLVGL